MANTEVGSAYVSIYPKTDGTFNKKVGNEIGGGVSTGVSAKAVAIGNIVSSVVMQAATAAAEGIGAVIGGALSNYANYEQLVGGVETLFGESASQVQAYADQAFRSAGLSANAYMETVTGFSASLLQSLEGDTQKAAQVADMAVRDMSDNANKMGSDMASIQNAYQGFAKQNYTMLDNLKLGYGGTKAEMERLLADASELAGVEFSIDSYADVIEAIHVMQESMGIAGTTAEEASSTIEGSVNTMKAAWDNWLTALGNEDADFEAKTQELVDSVVAAAKNVIPRLGQIVATIITELPTLLGEIAAAMPEMMAPIGDAIRSVLVAAFGEDAGNAVFDAVSGLIDTVSGALQTLWDALAPVRDAIASVAAGIGERLGPVVEAVSPLLSGLGDILGGAVGLAFQAIATAVTAVADAISWLWDNILAPFGEWLQSTFGPIIEGIGGVLGGIGDAIGGAVEFIGGGFDAMATAAGDAFDAIGGAVTGGMDAASQAVTDYGSTMVQTMGGDWQALSLQTNASFGAVQTKVDSSMAAAAGSATASADKISSAMSFSNVASTAQTAFDKAAANMQTPVDAAKRDITAAPDEIVASYSGLGSRMSDAFGTIHFPQPHVSYRSVTAGDETVQIPVVDWYALGGFVDKPTLIGAGEAGPEMVLPERGGLMDRFADALSSRLEGGGGGVNIYLQYDAGEDATALANDIAMILNRKLAMEA